MKGPGIRTYLDEIAKMKTEAIQQGEDYLEVNSKELHARISPSHATMPTCCQAIYKTLLEGDEIIRAPRGTTGFGSYLTVRYYLSDMDNRARLFPDKKRGRPAKSEAEKLAARKARLKRSGEELKQLIHQWLKEKGWESEVYSDYIRAHNDHQEWVIQIEGIRRGRKVPITMKVSELLKYMNNEQSMYSIAFNDSLSYRRQWEEIPKEVKNSLRLSVIFTDKKGNITVL